MSCRNRIALASLGLIGMCLPPAWAVPPGRVGVHGLDPLSLLGNNAQVQGWVFESDAGVLVPDPDGDAAPWDSYLSNDSYRIEAVALGDPVLVDDWLMLDIGTQDFWSWDFWYTPAGENPVPGPILPLSGVLPDSFGLRIGPDGTMAIVRNPIGFPEGNWTYSYTITSPSGSLIPDPDGDASPYLTYLSNTSVSVSAATSNSVVIEDSLTLDAKFDWSGQKDLAFTYEVIDLAPAMFSLSAGGVTYVPEPSTLLLLGMGALGLLAYGWRRRWR